MPRQFSASDIENLTVKIYHGYGHTHNMVVYGHVFKKRIPTHVKLSNRNFPNFITLLKMFMVQPLPNAKVSLQWHDQILNTITEKDGFFKFEWKSEKEVHYGWHTVQVNLLNDSDEVLSDGTGKIYIPHSTQYGFISDIDDTILVSHTAKNWKGMKEVFFKNPQTRLIFDDVALHYSLLANEHTTTSIPNPFFYVSSSEWNLYDYLNNFFTFNGLPKGAFLLNHLKQWFQIHHKTRKAQHNGKMVRIIRILEAFPKQQFILFGDNAQEDPSIYSAIARAHPGRIVAVYIRNVQPSKENSTEVILSNLQKSSIHTLLFKNSASAIEHSKHIGLIN